MNPRTLLASSLLIVGCASSSDSPPKPATVPLQAHSPWPKFRGNAAQDGRSAIMPVYDGGRPWAFPTGKGIFSSPIVGADGTVYIGSADRNFYALKADGTLRWKVPTGEIVDSAGLLDDRGRVYFGSGDGKLRALDAASGSVVWTMTADDPKVNKAFINWFEGNVAIGVDGTLYVPNDNFFVYAIDRDTGSVRWRRKMPDQTWSLPAVDEASGTLFLGNNNLLPALGRNTFALDPKTGEALWETSTLGTISASPLYSSGMVFVGGFDGWIRAYDAISGDEKWSFATRDHVYASPALLPDGAVVAPSCDGTVYALEPKTGKLRWAFDAGEPIRSSPAVDGAGNVYFGGGDGRLWVLGPDGKHRWSMQLTADARNDLNASPALGAHAVYLAGESGEVFGIPYEYCLSPAGAADTRCRVGGEEALPRDGVLLRYTTAYGALVEVPPPQHANRPITLSLVVRAAGDTRLATLDASTFDVKLEPEGDATVEISGDGRFVTITPNVPFQAGTDGKLRITASGKYLVDHEREGLRLKKGAVGGEVKAELSLSLVDAPKGSAPIAVPKASGDAATTWQIARLALPMPTMMPSYNQIGFDSLHYAIGVVEGTADGTRGIAWMVGALLDEAGQVKPDPSSKALMPLEWTYQGGLLTMRNEDGLKVEVMNAVIPFRTFRIATALDDKGLAIDETTLSGSSVCAKIPFYGPFLQTLGLCNPQTDLLGVVGAAKLLPLGTGQNKGPGAVGVVKVSAEADAVVAKLEGSTLDPAAHVVSLLLVDATSGRPITLDYGLDTTRVVEGGKLTGVRIPLGGKVLPSETRVHLLVDTYPAATSTLGE